MNFANYDVYSNIKYHEKDYEICNFDKNAYSCDGFLLEDQSVSCALQSLKHQISSCETNDSYSRHECLEDPLCDQDTLGSLNHEPGNCETNEKSSFHDFLENPLCVPQDPIESVEWMNSLEFDSLDSLEYFFPRSPDISEKKRPRFQKVKKDKAKENTLSDISNVKTNHTKKSPWNKRSGRGRSLKYKKQNVVNRNNAKKIQRRCRHCEVRETPQWRMGPEGPNTLCNACGMRYKEGKLFQEYMPAASPVFDVGKHSNVHKKLLKNWRI